jgi:hypothetical protein
MPDFRDIIDDDGVLRLSRLDALGRRFTDRDNITATGAIITEGSHGTDIFVLPPEPTTGGGAGPNLLEIVRVNLDGFVAEPDFYDATIVDFGLPGGAISDVTMVNPGAGYDPLNPPAVTITGDGSGATAVAMVDVGGAVKVHVTTGGSGYSSAMVSIDPPPGPAGTQATAVAVIGANPDQIQNPIDVAKVWVYSANAQVLQATHYYPVRLFGVITLTPISHNYDGTTTTGPPETRPLYVLAQADAQVIQIINPSADQPGVYSAALVSFHLDSVTQFPSDDIWLYSPDSESLQPGDYVAGIPNGDFAALPSQSVPDPETRALYIQLPKSVGGTVINRFTGFPVYVDDILRTIPCSYPASLKAQGPPYPADVTSTLRTGFGMDFMASAGYAPSGSGTIYSTTPGIDWGALYADGSGDTGTNCTIRVRPIISYPPPSASIIVTNITNVTIIDNPPPYPIEFDSSCSIYWVGWVDATNQVIHYQPNWRGFQVWGNWGNQITLNTSCMQGDCLFQSQPQTAAAGFNPQTDLGFDTFFFDPCDFILKVQDGTCGPTSNNPLGLRGLEIKTLGATTVISIAYLDPSCTNRALILCFRDGLLVRADQS